MNAADLNFGPMVQKVVGSIYYEVAPRKRQEVTLAGVCVGTITADYKRSFDTASAFVVESYRVDIAVPTVNGAEDCEWFDVRRYASARAALAAAKAYFKAAVLA